MKCASTRIHSGPIEIGRSTPASSSTGRLRPFQRGFERIVANTEAPIVPVALAGVWGSIFSFAGGKFFWKWPRRLRRAVIVNFGRPLPPTATADEVHAAVEKLLTADGAIRPNSS